MLGKLLAMAQRISTHPFQRRALAGVALAFTLAAGVMPATTFAQQGPMKIHLHIDGAIATATLDNNAAARDFVAQLPLSLTLQNYAEIERIATLPRKLSVDGAPAGITPKPVTSTTTRPGAIWRFLWAMTPMHAAWCGSAEWTRACPRSSARGL